MGSLHPCSVLWPGSVMLCKLSTKTILGRHARIEAYMFTMPQNTIAYLHKEPIDMRYGMFRLQGVIARQRCEPMPRGAFYFFINKGHSLLKAVWFDGTGLCLFSKRLEKGTFTWPQPATYSEEKWMQITPSALSLLLDGIELKQCMKKAWYEA